MPVRVGGSWILDPASGELTPNIPAELDAEQSPADVAGDEPVAPAPDTEPAAKSGRRKAASEET